MSRCSLQDLGGIHALPKLQELYLPFNSVADVSPLYFHDSLEVLDLEGNNVCTLEDVSGLATCIHLCDMTIASNPVCNSPGFSRQAILDAIPQLATLDDTFRDDVDPVTHLVDRDEVDALLCEVDCMMSSSMNPSSWHDSESVTSSHEFDVTDTEEWAAESTATTTTPLTPWTPPPSTPTPSLLMSKASKEDWDRARTLCAAGPSEMELVIEGLKRTESQHIPLRQPDRAAATQAKQTTVVSHFAFQPRQRKDVELGSHHASSDLTSGAPLAGNPLSVARQKRNQSHAAMPGQDVDIRSLLQRYQTYVQASCLPDEELQERCLQAAERRPGTPDVRIQSRPGTADARMRSQPGRARGFEAPDTPAETTKPLHKAKNNIQSNMQRSLSVSALPPSSNRCSNIEEILELSKCNHSEVSPQSCIPLQSTKSIKCPIPRPPTGEEKIHKFRHSRIQKSAAAEAWMGEMNLLPLTSAPRYY